MPYPTATQRKRRPNSEPPSRDEPPFRFSAADLQELRDVLGDKLDGRSGAGALLHLQFAAAVYRSVRDHAAGSRRARKELARLDALLRQVEELDAALSPDANLILERAWIDLNAPSASRDVDARQALSVAAGACAQVRARIKPLQSRSRALDNPGWFLAHGVAAALIAGGEPLSRGRDGSFARVLTVVWHAVEPKGAPEELFPYLKRAADVAGRVDPQLPKAPKGRRPRRRK